MDEWINEIRINEEYTFALRYVSFHPMNIFSVARQIKLYIVSIELQLSYWPLREMAKEKLTAVH